MGGQKITAIKVRARGWNLRQKDDLLRVGEREI